MITFKEYLEENFLDGKKPGRKGLAKRVGVDCSKSETELRKLAKNSSGEKQRMAHWCANMKKESDDPCWDGYQQVEMKKKNGKEVPNCVPVDS